MKLTRRSVGYRYRKPSWTPEKFIDVWAVSTGFEKHCRGVDHNGLEIYFRTSEDDAEWICLGSTAIIKRGGSPNPPAPDPHVEP